MHGVALTLLLLTAVVRRASSAVVAAGLPALRCALPVAASLTASWALAQAPAPPTVTPPASPASGPAAVPPAAALPTAATPVATAAVPPVATAAAPPVATAAATPAPAATPAESAAAPAATVSPAPASTATAPAESTAPAPAAATSPATVVSTVVAVPTKTGGGFLGFVYSLAVLLVLFGLPIAPAWYVRETLRMPEHAPKAYLLTLAILLAASILLTKKPNLGVDLRGGVNLVYGLRKSTGTESAGEMLSKQANMDRMIGSLKKRIDPAGLQEITIRQFGQEQIEIIMPGGDATEAAGIKAKLSNSGSLTMRILADEGPNAELIRRARLEREKGFKRVYDETDPKLLVAEWVPAALDDKTKELRADLISLIQNPRHASYIPPADRLDVKVRPELLVMVDPPGAEVTGEHLRSASVGIDEYGGPQVSFRFDAVGATRMGRLTGDHLPLAGQEFLLCVILDDELFNAATIRGRITDSGQITGKFTVKEVQEIVDVLNAGSLPVSLDKEPQMELVTSATLGEDGIRWGAIAISVSFVSVLAFMAWYYRFAGYVAVFAVLLNLLFTVALMVQIDAAFTLPGLAGLVLTVGMAVDANVLIFERIREELDRGATLRMAIRNGYQRAFSTIVDANLTTLITATVLYAIGSDQIKGFAVSLWLGIALSMFSAIFCTRLVFDIWERQRWLTELKMRKLLDKTNYDFISYWKPAVTVSLVVIAIGMLGLIGRGSGILDIDFLGGSSVHVRFDKPQDYSTVRTKVVAAGDELPGSLVKSLRDGGDGSGRQTFIVDTSRADIDQVKATLTKVFQGELAHNSLTFTEPKSSKAPAATTDPAGTAPATTTAPAPAATTPETDKKTSFLLPAMFSWTAYLAAEGDAPKPAEPAKTDATAAAKTEATAPAAATTAPAATATTTAAPAAAATTAPAAPVGPTESCTADIKLAYPLTYDKVMEAVGQVRAERKTPWAVDATNRQFREGNNLSFEDWTLRLETSPAEAGEFLTALKAKVDTQPYFPFANKIGSQVAVKTQFIAIQAILLSFFFIVLYVWFRFHRLSYGLAAVVSLFHDILIMLAAVSLSAYVAPALGIFGVEAFKINLAIIAAFLTIVGYSINDTIVIFDRIREVKGKSPQLTVAMINRSMNETLSRTILTSLTTLIVCVILYAAGVDSIKGFAFSLVVGVISGTYSTVFIACPVLIWLGEVSPEEVKAALGTGKTPTSSGSEKKASV